ncbi:MAG: hypothetical protein NC901_03165 [Candidatus Omnitrophica bacterium]|nr:hypothetical protein [Candidatus Omnitrophota bacterium]
MDNFVIPIEALDYNLALNKTPPEVYKIYYKMIEDDSHIHMLYRALKSFVSSRYILLSLTNINEKILNFINENLKRLNLDIYGILDLAIPYLMYGASFFLKEYKYDKTDKKYYLSKLQYIEPASIINFEYDTKPPYDVKTIEIYGRDSNGGFSTYKIDIKNFWIVSDTSDSFVNGKSFLKSIYKLYKIKSMILQILPLSVSRSAVYIPIAYVKGKLDEERENKLIRMLSNINASYTGSAVIQKDLIEQIDGLQDKRNPYPFANLLDFINKEMTKSFLAFILSFGMDRNVPYQIQDFYRSLIFGVLDNAIKKIIYSFTNSIMSELVEMNFGEKMTPPEIKIKRIGDKFSDIIDSKTLFNLAQYKLITPDEKLEKWLRELIGLPTEEEVKL